MIYLLAIACSTQDTKESSNLTFYADAQPIIENHCVRCHSDAGQGVGDFTNPDTVIAMAELIGNSIETNQMPPPTSDPECQDYLDSDMLYMQQESKDLLLQWIEEGAELGDPETGLSYDRSIHTLVDPDLTITLQEPYTPRFEDSNNPGNEYRCFAIPHGQTENFYITELHPIVDNPEMVHHIVLAKGTDDGILSGSTSPQGVDCINDGAFISSFLNEGGMMSGWAPGMSPIRFPGNAGLLVRPDEYIVIQLHYYYSDSIEKPSDQSGYMFKIADNVEETIQMLPLGYQSWSIPAGDANFTQSNQFNLPFGIKVWGVFPHMHVLGSGYEFTVSDADGEEDECLVRSEGYDFNNQISYIFDDPIEVTNESTINWSCSWDNSADNPNQFYDPPQDISYGERTDEEMCYAFTLVSF